MQFDFPVCKLLDLVAVAREVGNRGKPSAVIVLANWAAQQTRQDMTERSRVKWNLTRRLYEADLGKKDVLELYRLIDWLLRLPPELEQDFKRQVRDYEESKTMPYVTSIERLAKEEGREEGRAEVVLRLLRRRWEALPSGLEVRIRVLSLEQQANLAEALFDFTSLGDLETWLSAHGNRG